MRNNFIGGAWTRGADTRDNINPSDTTDVIGEYAQFIPGLILTLGAGFAFNQAYQSVGWAMLVGTASVWVGA